MLAFRAKPILGCLVAAAVSLPAAWAQPTLAAPATQLRHNYLPPPARVAEAPYSATPANACIPMCHNDYLPCDPIYFKLGDGRCTWKIW